MPCFNALSFWVNQSASSSSKHYGRLINYSQILFNLSKCKSQNQMKVSLNIFYLCTISSTLLYIKVIENSIIKILSISGWSWSSLAWWSFPSSPLMSKSAQWKSRHVSSIFFQNLSNFSYVNKMDWSYHFGSFNWKYYSPDFKKLQKASKFNTKLKRLRLKNSNNNNFGRASFYAGIFEKN